VSTLQVTHPVMQPVLQISETAARYAHRSMPLPRSNLRPAQQHVQPQTGQQISGAGYKAVGTGCIRVVIREPQCSILQEPIWSRRPFLIRFRTILLLMELRLLAVRLSYFLSDNLLTQWNEACNLGLVYGNMTDQTIADIGSCVALGNGPDPSGTFDCDCCQTSQLISNIFNICPSSNLSSIGFDSWFADQEKSIKNSQVSYSEIAAMAGGGPLGNCTILNTPDTCVSKYKLPIEGTKWWNPLALPAGVPGTEALSDVAGA
jgi:hypothetical protein